MMYRFREGHFETRTLINSKKVVIRIIATSNIRLLLEINAAYERIFCEYVKLYLLNIIILALK